MYSVVRDRQKVWPYCTKCGCRLNIERLPNYGLLLLSHFLHELFQKRDARGHICEVAKWSFSIQEYEIEHIRV